MRIHARYIGKENSVGFVYGNLYELEVETCSVSGIISIERINKLGRVSNTLLFARIEMFLSSFTNITNIEK